MDAGSVGLPSSFFTLCDLAVVMQQDQSPKGLPLALLTVTHVDAGVRRLASAQTRHNEGREEMGKGSEDI